MQGVGTLDSHLLSMNSTYKGRTYSPIGHPEYKSAILSPKNKIMILNNSQRSYQMRNPQGNVSGDFAGAYNTMKCPNMIY